MTWHRSRANERYISNMLTGEFAAEATSEESIMPAVVNREECVSCGTCVEECPEEAISLDEEEIAVVNKEKCNECGTCVEACPSEAISME